MIGLSITKERQCYKDWVNRALSEPLEDRYTAVTVLRNDALENGGEEFIEEELAVAAALAVSVLDQGKKAIRYLDDAILSSDPYNALATAIEKAGNIMRASFSVNKTEEIVTKNISSLLDKGSIAATGDSSLLRNFYRREAIIKNMIDASKYYTNNYFNNQVVPSLIKEINKIIDTAGSTSTQEWGTIRDLMDKRLKTVPYWRVVANSAASRAYHYGVVKAGQLSKKRGYRIKATIDSKTSDICRKLNGKEFWLSDAVNLMESVLKSQPEDVKFTHPWVNFKDVENKNNRQLASEGIIMPPFHGNCRTTIELF